MSEAWLAGLVPVVLMAATIALQRLEHRLLGPAPPEEDEPAPRRRGPSASRSAGPPAR